MIALDNYYKKTPRWAKTLGDILLFSAPLISGAIVASPFDEVTKTWALFITNIVLVVGKILTKFMADEATADSPNPDL